MTARRCIAPIDDAGHLCGAPATDERVVEGLACALCAEHAAEFAAETETTDETN